MGQHKGHRANPFDLVQTSGNWYWFFKFLLLVGMLHRQMCHLPLHHQHIILGVLRLWIGIIQNSKAMWLRIQWLGFKWLRFLQWLRF